MATKKIVKKVQPYDSVHPDTGEFHDNVLSVNIEDNEFVIMDSTDYFVLNVNAVNYIRQNFTPFECGKILQMVNMVAGRYNILHDTRKFPHTHETLMEDIEVAKSFFYEFIRKLYAKSVIYYIVGVKKGKNCLWIMLNPTIARKTRTMSKDCVNVFENLDRKDIGKVERPVVSKSDFKKYIDLKKPIKKK